MTFSTHGLTCPNRHHSPRACPDSFPLEAVDFSSEPLLRLKSPEKGRRFGARLPGLFWLISGTVAPAASCPTVPESDAFSWTKTSPAVGTNVLSSPLH